MEELNPFVDSTGLIVFPENYELKLYTFLNNEGLYFEDPVPRVRYKNGDSRNLELSDLVKSSQKFTAKIKY